MPSFNAISIDQLARLIGTPACPLLLDLREGDDPRGVPGGVRMDHDRIDAPRVVTICGDGGARSHGAAALLRTRGIAAEALEGGFAGWVAAGKPIVDARALPPRDAAGRTLWVTRARPKIDRIACPWLIRRFVDPCALFLFVPAGDVGAVAELHKATPFDVAGEGARWTHDGEFCTFDAMLAGFGLAGFAPLDRVAGIVRGADTARLDMAPEAAGLLAISLGLSRMYIDDLAQLDAGLGMYDALYRWARDATGETHDWQQHVAKGARA